MVTITRRYTFAAAHQLHGLAPGHKCARLHGHNYEVRVTLAGVPALNNGFVLDAADVDALVAPLVAELDHRTLNELEEPNADPALCRYGAMKAQPTAENIAIWLWNRLCTLPGLQSVAVQENERLWATVSR